MNNLMISDNLLIDFKHVYALACDNMQRASGMAYELYNTYGKDFKNYCTSELLIGDSTFSKMIKAGEMIRTNPQIDLNDIEYSKLYMLKDVQGELKAFQEYVDKPLKSLSQREIKKKIKDFWNENGANVTIKEDEHKATKVTCVNLWEALEDAIMDGTPRQGLLDILYKLRKEVTGE